MVVVYPGAERLGPEEGSPPASAVYKGDKVVAYIFSTLDIIAAPGYSVIPFDVIAGVEPDGRITGAKVVFHREPYVYHDAVRQPQLDTFLAAEAGMPLNGSASQLRLTSGEGAAALTKAGAPDAAPDVPLGKPDDLYSEVFFGLLTPAAIGGNLLGVRNFEDYRRRMPNGRHVLFFASNGPYNFHGTNHWWKAHDYRFDRIRIVQDGQTIGVLHEDYQALFTR